MPVKKRADKRRGALSEAQWAFLTDNPWPAGTGSIEKWILEFDGGPIGKPSVQDLWRENRDQILAEYIVERPGTRPSLWWKYDAPRQAPGMFPNDELDGAYPQTRQRTNNARDQTSYAPLFTCGVPDEWSQSGGVVIVESEAAYLQRHNLLFDGERERLNEKDFESVVLK